MKGYTTLDNRLLRDTRISYKALGLLTHLLSHTDGWNISAERLVRESGEQRSAILTALKELRAAGYLVTMKGRGADGKITTVNTLYDAPVGGWPVATGSRPDTPTGVRLSDSGSSDVGSSGVGKPDPFRKTIPEVTSKKEHQRKIINNDDPNTPAGSVTTGADPMRRPNPEEDDNDVVSNMARDDPKPEIPRERSRPATTNRVAWKLAEYFLTHADPAYRVGLGTHQAFASTKIQEWLEKHVTPGEFERVVDLFIAGKQEFLPICEKSGISPWILFTRNFESLLIKLRSAHARQAEANISAEMSPEERQATARNKYSLAPERPSPWEI